MKFQLAWCIFAVFGGFQSGLAVAGYDEGLKAYQNGNYEIALLEFSPIAEQGDARAQFHLGLMYNNGRGVQKDDKTAAKWHQQAAEQGNADSQNHLGVMHRMGHGVPLDYKESIRFWRQAAAQANAFALLNLCETFSSGVGVQAKNSIVAYALCNLSSVSDASSHVNDAHFSGKFKRDNLAKTLSAKEIEVAQDLTREMSNQGNVLNALDAYLDKLPAVRKVIQRK